MLDPEQAYSQDMSLDEIMVDFWFITDDEFN